MGNIHTIQMGLNTAPDFQGADETIARFQSQGNAEMVERWKNAKTRTLALRDEILEALHTHGTVELNWSCTGATLFGILAHQWKNAMPEADFKIGRYSCILTLKS